MKLRQFDKAAAKYTKVIGRFKQPSETYIKRAECYIFLHDYAGALDDLNYVLNIEPTNTAALFTRGAVYLELKDSEKAEKDFTSLVKINPSAVGGYCGLGLVSVEKKDPESALNFFRHAVRVNGRNSCGYDGLANIYAQKGQLQESLNMCERSLEINPKNVKIWLTKAVVHIARKEMAAARADLNGAEPYLDDNSKRIYYTLSGLLNMSSMNFQQGCRDLKRMCDDGSCQFYELYKALGVCEPKAGIETKTGVS